MFTCKHFGALQARVRRSPQGHELKGHMQHSAGGHTFRVAIGQILQKGSVFFLKRENKREERGKPGSNHILCQNKHPRMYSS